MAIDISGQQAARMIKAGEAVLVDVRTPAEFGEVRATTAVNLPLDRLTKEALASAAQGKRVVFICRSGKRGQTAIALAASWGLDCDNVVGGTMAWESEGLGVARGEATVISLERQVRIAAGGLVVIGTLLGLFGWSWALGIPLFVGAGLVFAGVTDTCGMAMLLGRMPWNQGCGGQCAK
jgi:rhodanese-related sulfurtransferase